MRLARLAAKEVLLELCILLRFLFASFIRQLQCDWLHNLLQMELCFRVQRGIHPTLSDPARERRLDLEGDVVEPDVDEQRGAHGALSSRHRRHKVHRHAVQEATVERDVLAEARPAHKRLLDGAVHLLLGRPRALVRVVLGGGALLQNERGRPVVAEVGDGGDVRVDVDLVVVHAGLVLVPVPGNRLLRVAFLPALHPPLRPAGGGLKLRLRRVERKHRRRQPLQRAGGSVLSWQPEALAHQRCLHFGHQGVARARVLVSFQDTLQCAETAVHRAAHARHAPLLIQTNLQLILLVAFLVLWVRRRVRFSH
mmetsp:Transcript_38266/g.71768  ORF Transcript_38266/g.71768 Transcript_38266/m.71768 type:complete len:310 (+) Transcript_38266:1108-2037(+)